MRSNGLQWLSDVRNPHGHFFAYTFQLNDLTSLFWSKYFVFGIPHVHSSEWPPLEYNQSINMLACIHTGCCLILRFPNHPPDFPMTNGTCGIPYEIKIGSQNKITADLFV